MGEARKRERGRREACKEQRKDSSGKGTTRLAVHAARVLPRKAIAIAGRQVRLRRRQTQVGSSRCHHHRYGAPRAYHHPHTRHCGSRAGQAADLGVRVAVTGPSVRQRSVILYPSCSSSRGEKNHKGIRHGKNKRELRSSAVVAHEREGEGVAE
jgi:hypothetical protein